MISLIPKRAAIWAFLVAVFGIFIAWVRRDARADLAQEIKQKDMEHAQDITDRVSRDSADPERMRAVSERGYRD